MPPSRFRIPSHVFGYTLATIPAIGYVMYWQKNHESDEELERKLMKHHGDKIKGNREKNQQMTSFFQAMKDGNKNSEQEARIKEVLQGGKGTIKRHYAVDKTLYGTKEGMAMREETLEKEEKKARKKEKKKKSKENLEKAETLPATSNTEQTSLLTKNTVSAAVGGLALAAVVLLGGKKGQ